MKTGPKTILNSDFFALSTNTIQHSSDFQHFAIFAPLTQVLRTSVQPVLTVVASVILCFGVWLGIASAATLTPVNAQSASGLLSVFNNTQPQSYSGAGIAVRTNVYICPASGGIVSGIGSILPGQSFIQTVPADNYTIRIYNEVLPQAQVGANSFMSSDPFYYGLVCQNTIPNSIVATITDFDTAADNQVTVSGVTQATLVSGSVPGVEIPLFQASPSNDGITTSLRVVRVDYREAGVESSQPTTTAFTAVCIDNTNTNATDPAVGDFELEPGQYAVSQVVGGLEVTGCSPLSQNVMVTEGTTGQLSYLVVDDQSGFSGVTGSAQTIQLQGTTPPITTTPPTNTTGNQPNTLALFDGTTSTATLTPGTSTNLSTANVGLIRSGGNVQSSTTLAILSLFIITGAVMLSDTLLTKPE